MKKLVLLSLLIVPITFLSGCNKEEKEKIAQEVTDFKPVKKYTDARAEEYIVEEKDANEIASEVFKEQIGILNNKETSFSISGNLDKNIFVQSAVADGKNIPTIPNLNDKQIKNINDDGLSVWEEDNITDYDELIVNRDATVEKMDGTSEKKLAESIDNAMKYQEKIKDNK